MSLLLKMSTFTHFAFVLKKSFVFLQRKQSDHVAEPELYTVYSLET